MGQRPTWTMGFGIIVAEETTYAESEDLPNDAWGLEGVTLVEHGDGETYTWILMAAQSVQTGDWDAVEELRKPFSCLHEMTWAEKLRDACTKLKVPFVAPRWLVGVHFG